MRTSGQLRAIVNMANALREERGDTQWSPEDRDRVADAFNLLKRIGPPVRVRREPGT